MPLCIPISLTLTPYEEVINKIRSHKRKKEDNKKSKDPEPPKPKTRLRQLMLPKDAKSWKRALVQGYMSKHASPQTQSRLCQLPTELKMMVYERVLQADKIHIHFTEGFLHGTPCLPSQTCFACGAVHEHWDVQSGELLCNCRWAFYKEYRALRRNRAAVKRLGIEKWEAIKVLVGKSRGIGMLPLMLTCRRLQSEVTDMVYKRLTFIFHHPIALLLFASFVPSKSFQNITSLHFDTRNLHPEYSFDYFETPLSDHPAILHYRSHEYGEHSYLAATHDGPTLWSSMCATIATMKGLRQVHISITGQWFESLGQINLVNTDWTGVGSGSERNVIEPLAQSVRIMGKDVRWKVQVGWPERKKEDWTSGLFIIERKAEVV